jgi:hypothetical protein
MWKIGPVMRSPHGYGFNVTTDKANPLVWFEYETEDEAKAAAKQGKRLLSELWS